ncbi:MAG TPA: preprotein translocase subunit SecG [Acidobacteriota bacterium]|nr:preprotein translocase subunit SecG [Acidobacteriota bacterium]
MFVLLVLLHIIVSLILILVVLLQSGKAGDLASTFGGATSQTAFGSRGAATVLTKATAISGVIFMLTSLGLAILYTQGTDSTLMDRLPYQDTPAAVQPEESGAEPSEAQPQESPSPAPEEAAPAEEPAPPAQEPEQQ